MSAFTFPHLCAAIDFHAERKPSAIAYRYLHRPNQIQKDISYQELRLDSYRVAGRLAPHLDVGDLVLILFPTGPEFVRAWFGCCRAGLIPVPSYPLKPGSIDPQLDRLEKLIEVSGAKAICTLSGESQQIQSQAGSRERLSKIAFFNLDQMEDDRGDFTVDRHLSPDRPAMLLYTSGSTGEPKGVQITHRAIVSNYAAFTAAFDLDESATIATWLPNSHIAGFYLRTLAIALGGKTVVFPVSHFLERPVSWLEVVHQQNVQISAAPSFAYDIVRQLPPEAFPADLDLSCWKLAITGGEVVQSATVRGLVETLSPFGFRAEAFTPYYGMTETLCTSVHHRAGIVPSIHIARQALEENRIEIRERASANSQAAVSNGKPLGEHDLRIVSPETKRDLGEDTVGEIWTRGPSVTPGYWQRDDINAELCQARIEGEKERAFFRTGDLGFLHNGELYITGRLKELIIIRGKNYYPKDIESTVIQALAPSKIAALVAFGADSPNGEVLAIAIECDSSQSIDEKALRSSVMSDRGLSIEFLVVVPPMSLPRTSSGKIQRGRCRQLLAQGVWGESVRTGGKELKPLIWDRNAFDIADPEQAVELTRRFVLNQLLTVTRRETCDFEDCTTLNALGLDSLQVVQLLGRLQTSFECSIPTPWFYEDIEVRTLLQRLVALLQGKSIVETQAICYDSQLQAIQTLCANLENPERSPIRHVFVTGGTGFLGSYLLRSLLQQTNWEIHVLVRAANKEAGRVRLLDAVSSICDLQPGWSSRLHAAIGNLVEDDFGLEAETFKHLAEKVDAIFHNGANVNFVAPYSALKEVNTGSTVTIVKLATTGKPKVVHAVSTIAVFNAPERDRFNPIQEEDFLESPDTLYSGYAQSKWVSERLLLEARSMGLNVNVYRPGLVSGDDRSGHCHTEDFLCRFIKGCLQMNIFPDLKVQVDMTPVNYCADAIVCLAKESARNKTYHLVNPTPITLRDLASWYKERGYRVKLEESATWHQRLSRLDEDNALYPIYPFLLEQHSSSNQGILDFFDSRPLNLDATNTSNALLENLPCPPLGDRLLQTYLNYFLNSGFLFPAVI